MTGLDEAPRRGTHDGTAVSGRYWDKEDETMTKKNRCNETAQAVRDANREVTRIVNNHSAQLQHEISIASDRLHRLAGAAGNVSFSAGLIAIAAWVGVAVAAAALWRFW